MTTEHRKAPRKTVTEIRRSGAWGKVKYEHVLECGHTEIRPRASTAPKIACAWCLRSKTKDLEIKALATPISVNDNHEELFLKTETEIGRVRAQIAHEFKVPLEQVDVVATDENGITKINFVKVFLSSADVRRITAT
jgi:hypothetical protein